MIYKQAEIKEVPGLDNQDNLVITNYFASINLEDFKTTADLFSTDGKLLAPFEQPIIGKQAIAEYLNKEAKGMKLFPQQTIVKLTEENFKQIKVSGKVQTSLFTVNVAWYFHLNQKKEITTVRIRLLASMKELLKFQDLKQQN